MTVCTVSALVRHFINGLSGRNSPIDAKKLWKFFLFKPDNIFMRTLKATTQLGDFNQRLLIRQSNKNFLYIGNHQHEENSIGTLFLSVTAHDGTAAIELISGTKILLTDVYAIGRKSGLNISMVFQDRFRKCGIPTNICYDNA